MADERSAPDYGHAARDVTIVYGLAVAPGVATGPVRMVRLPSDLERVQPGDVLVAPTAELRWLRDLGSTAAVVSDAGGVLCRGAKAARRAELPAVFGTGPATAVLRDGVLVEVDGNAGIVRIVDAVS